MTDTDHDNGPRDKFRKLKCNERCSMRMASWFVPRRRANYEMNRLPVLASLLALTTFAGPAAKADPDSCRDAVGSYSSAVDDVAHTVRRYTNCISNSEGRDDCSSEFRRLKNSQSDFESAVSAIGYECN